MTRCIVGGRRVGKTYRLLEHVLDNEDVTYLAATNELAMRAFRTALQIKTMRGEPAPDSTELTVFRRRFVGIDSVNRGWLRGGPRKYIIDDVEHVLTALLRADIEIITGSVDVEILNTPKESYS